MAIIRPIKQSYVPAGEPGPRSISDRPGDVHRWCARLQQAGSEVCPARAGVEQDSEEDLRSVRGTGAGPAGTCRFRELATGFTDGKKYFVSEALVYRLLMAYGLVTSRASVVVNTADKVRDKRTAPSQMWQTACLARFARSYLARYLNFCDRKRPVIGRRYRRGLKGRKTQGAMNHSRIDVSFRTYLWSTA